MSSVNRRLCKLFLHHNKAAIHVSHAMAKQGSTELNAFLSDFYNKDTMSRYLKFQVYPKGSHYDVSGNNACVLWARRGESDRRKGTRGGEARDRRRVPKAPNCAASTTPLLQWTTTTQVTPTQPRPSSDGRARRRKRPRLARVRGPGRQRRARGQAAQVLHRLREDRAQQIAKGGKGVPVQGQGGVWTARWSGCWGFLDLKGEALVGEINRRCGNNEVPVMQ